MLKAEEHIKRLYETQLELVKIRKENPILDETALIEPLAHLDRAIFYLLASVYDYIEEEDREAIEDLTSDYSIAQAPWSEYKEVLEVTLLGYAIDKMQRIGMDEVKDKLCNDADDDGHIPHID